MEQQLLFQINREWTHPALDQFMAMMSSLDFWTIPLAITALLLLIFGDFKMRAMLIVLGITVGISDGLVSDFLKKTVQRPRPYEVLADVRRVDLARVKPRLLAIFQPAQVRPSRPNPNEARRRSFPSSHTMNNFCAAIVMTFFFPRRGWLWFIVAAVIGYSRIYVGAHWPSDVAISVVLAFGVTLLVLPLCELLWRKIGSRVLPKIFAQHPSLFADEKNARMQIARA